MSRQSLSSVVALGALISALSGAGVMAIYSDTATTGPNDITSDERPRPQLGIGYAGQDQGTGDYGCAEFAADLSAGLFYALTDAHPGSSYGTVICLRNHYSAPVAIDVGAFDLVDDDPHCTGDEPLFDQTCEEPIGEYRYVQGELSTLLDVEILRWACGDPTTEVAYSRRLSTLDASPMSVGYLQGFGQGDDTWCVRVGIEYAPVSTYDEQQAAQTDRASWRFEFVATALE